MSIPLVQNNEKDSINTSIIAIKKNLERINSILGLVDSGSDIDTSEFVKKSDIVDVVQSGNMNPVTSNAVAEAFNTSTDNGWYIYKIGTKYIGLYSRSEGASTPITTSYGNMYLSVLKTLPLPQNVKNIQKVAGAASQTGGGVLYVSMNDTRADINIKTAISFYYASPVSYTANNCGALFYCFGDYE